jgi:hypothetical protein
LLTSAQEALWPCGVAVALLGGQRLRCHDAPRMPTRYVELRAERPARSSIGAF